MQLIKYRHSDGQIVSIWLSNMQALLAGHVGVDDTDYGYLFREEDPRAAAELLERWHIHAGQLCEKGQVMLMVEPATFLANGEDVCLVGVTPPTVCTLLVNGEPYALTDEDPVLTLTTTLPQSFVIHLQSHPTVWAWPVTVMAVEEE